MKSTVQLGGGSSIEFDWAAFSRVRKDGQKLAVAAAEVIRDRADAYPKPAASKQYRARKAPHISAIVEPATIHARRSNAEHNTLLKILGGM